MTGIDFRKMLSKLLNKEPDHAEIVKCYFLLQKRVCRHMTHAIVSYMHLLEYVL